MEAVAFGSKPGPLNPEKLLIEPLIIPGRVMPIIIPGIILKVEEKKVLLIVALTFAYALFKYICFLLCIVFLLFRQNSTRL